MSLSSQLKRLAAIGLLMMLGPAVQAQSCSMTSPRHVIRFYDYFGLGTADTANQFEQFRGVIDDELRSINDAINLPLKIHESLTTEPLPSSGSFHASGRLTPEVSAKLMSVDNSILELLDGTILSGSGATRYVIHSNIYVLPRQKESRVSPLSEDYHLDAPEADRARAVHIAAIYYALAIDAEAKACREQQIKFLTKAAELLKDVKKPGAGIKALQDRIAADQHALGLPGASR